jgi:hypothetical protein
VYYYAEKFNSLCQYGGHHVDTDAKKIERSVMAWMVSCMND